MAKIRVGGRNGQIFDMPETFTFREMRMMKRFTGLPAGKMHEGAEGGDTDVIAAFALVAMRRENKTLTEDAVLDLNIEEIEFLDDEEVMQGVPPTDSAATAVIPPEEVETPS